MRPIVECVPNFSDGRRPEVLSEIVEAICGVPGVTLLDHGMDPDHNRAVVTFVGAPQPVEEAAFRAAKVATARIDLSGHEGVHPRIGATDVVPFVPIGETPMEVCVELANRFGARVADELEIPVFLYGDAARQGARRELSALRRGGTAGLARRMAESPVFLPDFGPSALHPTAGGMAVGARFFLIAFNVDLDTDDLRVAEDIARAIRASSGGLTCVKALGLHLAGRGTTQVSMNLTDYRECSMGRVYRRIEELSRERGVAIRGSEVIGLVPRDAFLHAAEETLGLDLDRDVVLENRIQTAIDGPVGVHGFLSDLASTRPAPGGGAAAALSGALGAATLAKVFALTAARVRKRSEEDAQPLERAVRWLHALRWDLLSLLEQDSAAYEGFAVALKLPRGTEAEKAARRVALAEAAHAACETPLQIAQAAVEAVAVARSRAAEASAALASDALAACALCRGAIDAARAVACANFPYLADPARGEQLLSKFQSMREEVSRTESQLEARVVRGRGEPT